MRKLILAGFFLIAVGVAIGQTPMQLLHTIDSPFEDDSFSWGRSVKGNGDLNGDGYNDIIISGRPIGSALGRRDVYICLGGKTLSNTPDYIITDPAFPGPYNDYGKSITFSDDINGDGYCDLVISESQYGYDNWGRALVYYGGPDFDTIPDIEFNGMDYGIIIYGTRFGWSIDTSGDFNGDGYNDLVVSSAHMNEMFYGQINIFYGGPGLDTVSDWHYFGEVGEAFGFPFSVGDLNGDGFSDLAAYSSKIDCTGNRLIRIFLGGLDFDNQADLTYQVQLPLQVTELLMDTDFDRDGYDDLIISFVYEVAEFYILYGSAQIENTLELIHQALSVNTRSLYTAVFDSLTYLCYGTPQLESFNCYRLDEQEGWALNYIISEDYNPNAARQISYYLGDVNGDGHSEILLSNRVTDPVSFKVFTTKDGSDSIDDYTIAPIPNLLASPNPFINSSLLSYELKEPGKVELFVYNIKGQLVATLEDGYRGIGTHSASWDGRDQQDRRQPAGIYLVKLQLEQTCPIIKKVTLCY